MAYETKVILTLLAQNIAKAKSVKEAYSIVTRAANVEGRILPDYDQMVQEILSQQEQ